MSKFLYDLALEKNFYDNTYIDFVFNKKIVYYDMEKANISILRDYGIIGDEEYSILYNANKLDREIVIGKMIKNNKNIGITIDEGLKKYRKLLFNRVFTNDDTVLHVVKDGMFVILEEDGLHLRKFDDMVQLSPFVRFRLDGVYNIFMRLNSILWYYNDVSYKIRGMNEEVMAQHVDGFSAVLTDISELISNKDILGARDFCNKIFSTFESQPVNVKRRFDNGGLYDIKGYPYSTMFIDENQDAYMISGLYNESLIMKIESYLHQHLLNNAR